VNEKGFTIQLWMISTAEVLTGMNPAFIAVFGPLGQGL
jgi:hypothetical protein